MKKETASSWGDSAEQVFTGHANIANNNRSPKTSRILAHLVSGASLTPIEALNLYGSLRLSGVVFRLKARGYDIRTDIIRVGESRVARYSIKDTDKARASYFSEKGIIG